MSKLRRATSVAVRSEPAVRRAYFDCRYGQLHMHYAIPAGGGFDEAATLLCLPGAPGSGRFYRPLLAPLGRDRSVYAPDLPGSGESDPPPHTAGNAEYAIAMLDFVESMRFRSIDLLANGSGVGIALELLQLRPGLVGRMVLSPATEAVRAQARALRQPVLVIDLAAQGGAGATQDIERQALELRHFLGLP
jgi:pimeloyl-ACP methyl ester carboxylesterase